MRKKEQQNHRIILLYSNIETPSHIHNTNNNGVAQSIHSSDPPQIPTDFVFLLLVCPLVCVIFFFFSKSNDFHLLAIKLRRRIDANVRGKIPRVVR